jgi:hypothetical protein
MATDSSPAYRHRLSECRYATSAVSAKTECLETSMASHYRSSALLLAASLATACASGIEYQPRTPGSSVGYTDLQLSPNRYRVAFSGNYTTSRDDVELYLFRRAAEVTLQNGYTHFVIQMRDTERMTDYFGSGFPSGPLYYPYWGDSWAVSSYSSYAEILLLTKAEAASARDAVDAQRVLLTFNAHDASSVKTAAAPQ